MSADRASVSAARTTKRSMRAAAAAAHLATTLALAQSPVISLPPAERLRLDHRLLASTSDPVLAASLRPTFGFEVPAVIATGDRTAVVAAYDGSPTTGSTTTRAELAATDSATTAGDHPTASSLDHAASTWALRSRLWPRDFWMAAIETSAGLQLSEWCHDSTATCRDLAGSTVWSSCRTNLRRQSRRSTSS